MEQMSTLKQLKLNCVRDLIKQQIKTNTLKEHFFNQLPRREAESRAEFINVTDKSRKTCEGSEDDRVEYFYLRLKQRRLLPTILLISSCC